MKRTLIIAVLAALVLGAPAQTSKKVAKKATTTRTTSKKATSTKKSTSTTKQRSTTSSKSTVTPGKSTTPNSAKSTTNQRPTSPSRRDNQHNAAGHSRSMHHGKKGWNEVYDNLGLSFISYSAYSRTPINGPAIYTAPGLQHAFPLSQHMPLYLRVGGAFSYGYLSTNIKLKDSYKDDSAKPKVSGYMGSVKGVCDVGYKLPLGKMDIMPYAGLDAKINIFGHASIKDKSTKGEPTYDYDIMSEFTPDIDCDGPSDNTEMKAKRFQLGIHAGADVYPIRHLVLGAGFQWYTPLCSKTNNKNNEDDANDKVKQWSLFIKAGFVW